MGINMFERLVDIIVNFVEVNKEDITPDSRFMEDLGFTSFDFMSMLGELEDEFDIEIPNSQIKKFKTVKDIIKFIESEI